MGCLFEFIIFFILYYFFFIFCSCHCRTACCTIYWTAFDGTWLDCSNASKATLKDRGKCTAVIHQILLTHWPLGNFRHVIFKQILVIDGGVISCEIALIWMSVDFTDDQSTLVQVMAWCLTASSHYLSQCWPQSVAIWPASLGHNELNIPITEPNRPKRCAYINGLVQERCNSIANALDFRFSRTNP